MIRFLLYPSINMEYMLEYLIVEWMRLQVYRKQVLVPLFYESGTHIEVCLCFCLGIKHPLLHISTNMLLQFAIKQTIKLIQDYSNHFFAS